MIEGCTAAKPSASLATLGALARLWRRAAPLCTLAHADATAGDSGLGCGPGGPGHGVGRRGCCPARVREVASVQPGWTKVTSVQSGSEWLWSSRADGSGFGPAWPDESDFCPTGSGVAPVQSGERKWLSSSLARRK